MQAVLQLLEGGARAAAAQSKANVVRHAQVRIERVALEHHRHIPLGGAQTAHGPIAHKDLTTAGLVEACQEPQQGAFTAAGGAHQHQKFPICNLQIKLLQDLHRGPLGPAGREGLADLLESNLGQTGSQEGSRWPQS